MFVQFNGEHDNLQNKVLPFLYKSDLGPDNFLM